MAKKNKQNKKNDDYIILTDDMGNDVRFEFIDTMEYDEEDYVFLLQENSDEIMILRIDYTVDNEESYVGIDDENLLNDIFDTFKLKHKDWFGEE